GQVTENDFRAASRDRHLSGDSLAPAARRIPWSVIGPAAWIVGALLALIWITVGAWRTWHLLRRSHGAPEWIQRALRRVVPERRRPPRLRVNDRIESALACGTMRPAILLPESKAGDSQPESDQTAI